MIVWWNGYEIIPAWVIPIIPLGISITLIFVHFTIDFHIDRANKKALVVASGILMPKRWETSWEKVNPFGVYPEAGEGSLGDGPIPNESFKSVSLTLSASTMQTIIYTGFRVQRIHNELTGFIHEETNPFHDSNG